MRELDGAKLASFPRRAFAFVLDVVIGSGIFALPFLVATWMQSGHAAVRAPVELPIAVGGGSLELNFFESWYSVVWWVVYFGLTTYFGNGKTPGKLLMRIRVVSLVHSRMSLWHSIERALGYGASLLEFGFGFMQYFLHPNRRTVHDRIAETIVVMDSPPTVK